jgi:hypothetical protein
MNSPVVLLGIIGPTQLILIIVVIALLPQIFYLLTLQNTLSKVSPSNRKMVPGQVWLSLIPLFGMVWQFIVVTRMADSLQAEFRERGITVPEEKTRIQSWNRLLCALLLQHYSYFGWACVAWRTCSLDYLLGKD